MTNESGFGKWLNTALVSAKNNEQNQQLTRLIQCLHVALLDRDCLARARGVAPPAGPASTQKSRSLGWSWPPGQPLLLLPFPATVSVLPQRPVASVVWDHVVVSAYQRHTPVRVTDSMCKEARRYTSPVTE